MGALSLFMLAAFTLNTLVNAASVKGVCFDTNGVQDQGSLPCDPEADDSACCAFGMVCLSNGLCEPSTDQKAKNSKAYVTPFYTEFGCTDSSYNSSRCLSICDKDLADPMTGNGVQSCGDGDYCCYGLSDSGCCSKSSMVFHLDGATIMTTLGSSQTTSASSTDSASSTNSAPTTSSSAASASSPSEAAAVSSPTSSTTTSPPPTSTPKNNHVALGVGIGIGVPVGLAVVALAAFMLLRQRKNKRGTYADVKAASAQEGNGRQRVVDGSGGDIVR